MDIKAIIGRNVKALREEMNLSQSELADRANLSRFVVIKVENQQAVTLETMNRIAEACNVEPSLLLQSNAVSRSMQRHSELERDGAGINTAFYDSAFMDLPDYVQNLAKTLSVKLVQYLAPDNVRRELHISRENAIMDILRMMNHPESRKAVHNMKAEDATDHWVEMISASIVPSISKQYSNDKRTPKGEC